MLNFFIKNSSVENAEQNGKSNSQPPSILRKSSSASDCSNLLSAINQVTLDLAQSTPAIYQVEKTIPRMDSATTKKSDKNFSKKLIDLNKNGSSLEASPTESTTTPHQLGGMLGVFGRGFFAKPVMRTEEESYRYIMALDH